MSLAEKQRQILSDPAKLQVIEDFAELKISRHEAMNRLGLSWYGDLLDMVSASGRVMKTVPDDVAKLMVDTVVNLLKEKAA